MGLKDVFSGASSEAETEKNGMLSGVLGGIVSAQKSAIAANHAQDMLEEKKTGLINKAVDFVADTAGDVANVATFGVSRRVTNAISGTFNPEKKLDYKALKQAKKESEEGLSIQERADALAGYTQEDQDMSDDEMEL